MKNVIKTFFRNIDYRHYICIAITLGLITCSVFVFPYAFGRLLESGRDIGLSIAYFFCELFGAHNCITPSVPAYSKMPFSLTFGLSFDWDGFIVQWKSYWVAFIQKEYILGYFVALGNGALLCSKVFSVLLLIVLLFVCIVVVHFKKVNNSYNIDTKPLRIFKKISDKTYRPLILWLHSFIEFVKQNKIYVVLWALIGAYAFNFLSIVLEAIAFYLYLTMSFDFVNIYVQLIKFLLDLSVVPVSVWVVLSVVLFDKIRKKRGYDNLSHMELMNRGFINERGVSSLIVAPMRTGKTKMSVSMALSREIMFRDMALEIILTSDLKFPFFPWINLERGLRVSMNNHTVYNLVTVRRYVHSQYMRFLKNPKRRYIFDYDFERYSLEYNNGMYIEDLESVLKDYAQAYFIFVVESSLIVSNFSIRVDDIIEDVGNFPHRHADFFHTDPRLVDCLSRHSHILDYDALRLGKKVVGESSFAFEFGIIDITEIAKERLNQLESNGLKKTDDDTNQKNDGFESWVKMCGHNATVNYKCFVNIYCDDQREQNLGAGLREVGEILRIEDNKKGLLCLPFFFIGEIVYSISHNIISILHNKVRYARGDNSLLYYIIHGICAKYEAYYSRIYNTFGYEEMSVSVQDGAQNNEKALHKYFIMAKKDFAKRYSTDCLSESLSVRALRATWGLDDVPAYENERASIDELKKQNSYFIRDITVMLGSHEKKKKQNKQSEIDMDLLHRYFNRYR